jgi:hypothetical protein
MDQVENTISSNNSIVVFVLIATETHLRIHCLEMGCKTFLVIGLFHSNSCINRICLIALTYTFFGEHGVSSVHLNNRAITVLLLQIDHNFLSFR